MNTKETIEEAAERYSKRSSAEVFQKAHKRDFIAGAKWQQEKENSYSDLIDLLERLTPIYKEDSDLYEKYNKQRLELITKYKKN